MAGEVYTVRVHHEPGEELWAEVLELLAVSLLVPIWRSCVRP
jgi:hypothetical protein